MDDREHEREMAKLRAENARLKAEYEREKRLLEQETALRDKILREIAEERKRKKWSSNQKLK